MNLISNDIQGFDFDLSQLNKTEVININESKTPLAHVHAGSLRRIFLHFQLQQLLIEEGYCAEFFIGNDDYDPYDYFPAYFNDEQKKKYQVFLGRPLCLVPSPDGNGSYSDYYFSEMIEILNSSFGITVATYKTSELYQQGFFDEGIKLVLENIDKLNEIYRSVTGVIDKFSSRPLQVICPMCKNMRTTQIVNYRKYEVEIVCSDYPLKGIMFKGCGYKGWVSPYLGNARLVWKLEWPIRWHYLKIGVEGGRKDQNSEKGARKFAELAFRFLFHKEPPMNLPYDFCYVKSEHTPKINRFGISAIEALKFLPPKLFFDLLTKPHRSRPIDLNLESEKMLDVYRNYSKKYLCDHDGRLFSSILENARFGVLPIEQEFFAKNITHYLHTSDDVDAWFLDMTPKQVSKSEQIFLDKLVRGLDSVDIWQAPRIQYAFGEIVNSTDISRRDACALIYRLLINRQAGLRIGVLFEKIGKERLLTYLKSC